MFVEVYSTPPVVMVGQVHALHMNECSFDGFSPNWGEFSNLEFGWVSQAHIFVWFVRRVVEINDVWLRQFLHKTILGMESFQKGTQ